MKYDDGFVRGLYARQDVELSSVEALEETIKDNALGYALHGVYTVNPKKLSQAIHTLLKDKLKGEK